MEDTEARQAYASDVVLNLHVRGGAIKVSTKPFAVPVDGGYELTTPIGDPIRVKATTLDTAGSLTIIEFQVAPNNGPGVHIHFREDELWYVIEGEFRFKAGDAMLHASTGGFAFGPRGLPHAFQNIGETAGRLLVITTPSGLERFFDQYAELLPGPIDQRTLEAIAVANWSKFVGPPLAESDPL